MINDKKVVMRDYTTKELYELTRAKANTSPFFSKPSNNARVRIQQLDEQIKQRRDETRAVKPLKRSKG